MAKINGIYAAGMSILNDDLSLNVKETISHAERIIDQGCHGVAIFGSTGQAQLISISEKIDLLNNLSENNNGVLTIWFFMFSSDSTEEGIEKFIIKKTLSF